MFMRRVFKSMFTVYIYKDQSLSRPIVSDSDTLGWRGGGVGEMGVTWGQLWYGCASQYFKTYPIHIPGL